MQRSLDYTDRPTHTLHAHMCKTQRTCNWAHTYMDSFTSVQWSDVMLCARFMPATNADCPPDGPVNTFALGSVLKETHGVGQQRQTKGPWSESCGLSTFSSLQFFPFLLLFTVSFSTLFLYSVLYCLITFLITLFCCWLLSSVLYSYILMLMLFFCSLLFPSVLYCFLLFLIACSYATAFLLCCCFISSVLYFFHILFTVRFLLFFTSSVLSIFPFSFVSPLSLLPYLFLRLFLPFFLYSFLSLFLPVSNLKSLGSLSCVPTNRLQN